jgi:hypothetical protein
MDQNSLGDMAEIVQRLDKQVSGMVEIVQIMDKQVLKLTGLVHTMLKRKEDKDEQDKD